MSQGTGNTGARGGHVINWRTTLQRAWREDRRGLFKVVSAWLIFGAIILVFAFLGMTPHHSGISTGGAAAVVNGDIISKIEYSQAIETMGKEQRFQQLQQFGGEFAQQMIRQQAIRALVDQKLLGQNLGKTGILSSDSHVREAIAEIPAFQDQGKFSPTRYRGYLEASRQDAGEFESKVRQQISTNRMARTFASVLRPIPLERELMAKVESKKANVDVATIPTETLIVPELISSAEVKAFLEKSDSKGRLQAYFESNKERFSEQEKAKVRHILIRADRKDATAVEKARAEALKIVDKLKSGADFASVAKEKSADPGSAQNGGLIDFFARGAMVPEFEAYSFSGKIGEISSPIQTDFGFHIVKVEARKAASHRKLEDVSEEIAEILIAQEKSRGVLDEIQKLMAAGDAAGVEKLVSQYKLSWKETGTFSITADSLPGVGAGEKAVTTAFQLTPEKPIAKELIRQGAQAYLLKYKAVPPSTEAKAIGKKGKTETDKNAELQNNPTYVAETQAARRADEAFGQWVDVLRKAAKISVNPEVGKATGFGQSE
jgi:peptidyl-prolyl cis-trans isomerase D